MAVTTTLFDRLDNGQAIEKITLKNSAGTSASVLTLGASLQSLCFNNKDIVLGFDRAALYFQSGAYIGATVGRVCNRTADGRFELNGKTYTVACNESARQVHLHGGMVGFDKKIWSYVISKSEKNPQVIFSTISDDGEEGYPGCVQVSVSYTLTEDNRLILDYKAVSDKDTPLNLTNHTYFNLNGCDGDNVRGTLLRVCAEEYTPVTERLIPTGEYASVANTAIDFRVAKPIDEALNTMDDSMAYTGGVDHNFVLSHSRPSLMKAAVAYSPVTDIQVTCWTDLPGIQVYTGNFLDETGGKYGLKWGKHQGFCLETQFFPNSVNQPNFPDVILNAGAEFTSRTEYRLSLGREE